MLHRHLEISVHNCSLFMQEEKAGTPIFTDAKDTGVPGLALYRDFVSEQEEQVSHT